MAWPAPNVSHSNRVTDTGWGPSTDRCVHGFMGIERDMVIILHLRRWLSGKESTYQCRRGGLDPWVKKIPWRRKWQPAWRIPWTEKPGRLQSMELQRDVSNWALTLRSSYTDRCQDPRAWTSIHALSMAAITVKFTMEIYTQKVR